MDGEVMSEIAEHKRRLRPNRAVAILAATLMAVAALALNAVPAAATHDGRRVWQPHGLGYADFGNFSDGSELVWVCDTGWDSYRVWATFKFEGSTEQALWAPQDDCAYRMPGIRDGSRAV